MTSIEPPQTWSWVATILSIDGTRLGSGVVIDERRVLTCAHVIGGQASDDLRVVFPKADDDPFRSPSLVADVRRADHPQADVAVLELAEPIPDDVLPARLRRPKGADLRGRRWWAYGFSDEIGNDAEGVVGAELAFGWVRVDCDSRYRISAGFSGSGLWSPDYSAVVGLVGQARENGDGRSFTLYAATSALSAEKLSALTDGWTIEAAGDDAVAAWGWNLREDDEGRRHWRPRSRGVTSDSEGGYRFSGRRAALTAIVEWLQRSQLDRKVLLVTGSPGVGKSAVLGRVVTTADAGIAERLPSWDSAIRAPLGSVACAVHAKGKTALEVAHEIARAASAPLVDRVEDAVSEIRVTLAERGGKRFTVIIDALDEVTDPDEARTLVRRVLVPLAETCADVGAQVLVGTRRRDDGGDLIGCFAGARTEIDLDTSRYFEHADLVEYALSTLQLRGAERSGNPYADPGMAIPIAERIAEVASPNFLVAGLIARKHGLHDEVAISPLQVVAVDQADDPVEFALRDYLTRISGLREVSATEVLVALGYAEAPGLTLDLWAVAIRALTGAIVATVELEDFARGSAANFLIEASGAVASYRLFHQALNDALLAFRADRRQPMSDQQALTNAFLAAGRASGWDQAPPYLTRSLPHHAAAGEVMTVVLADTEFLLHADLRRLIPLAESLRSPEVKSIVGLLRGTPRALDAGPSERLALLSVTEAIDQVGEAFRHLSGKSPYRGRWANMRRGGEIVALVGHTGPIYSVCTITIGGRQLLASAGDDQTVRLWEPSTGELVKTLTTQPRHEFRAVCAVDVADRQWLATASGYGAIGLWDPDDRLSPPTLAGHMNEVRALCAVTVDGRALLASAGDSQTVRLWAPVTGEHVRTLFGHTGPVYDVCAISVGGRLELASAGDDQTVRLWDPNTGELLRTLTGHTGWVRAVCPVTVDGDQFLASAGDDRTVRLWDPSTGQLLRTLTGHTGWVRAVCAVTVDGRQLLASASSDQTVRLWDPSTAEHVRTLAGHTGPVYCVRPINAGNRELLASAGGDRTIRLWDPSSGNNLRQATPVQLDEVYGLCVAAIGGRQILVSGGDDRTVHLWDVGSGEHLESLIGHTGWVYAVCMVNVGDRQLLASTGGDRTIQLWHLGDRAWVARLVTGHSGTVTGMCAVTIEDRQLLASADEWSVRLCDPLTGEHVRTLDRPPGWIRTVCQVPVGDRQLLASPCSDGTVRLWDPSTGREIQALAGHTGEVRAVSSITVGDRQLLASAGDDRTVRLWDLTEGKEILTLTGHTDEVRALSTITVGDRQLLASASDDRTVRMWDPASGRAVTTIPVYHRALSITDTGTAGLAIGLTEGLLTVSVTEHN